MTRLEVVVQKRGMTKEFQNLAYDVKPEDCVDFLHAFQKVKRLYDNDRENFLEIIYKEMDLVRSRVTM